MERRIAQAIEASSDNPWAMTYAEDMDAMARALDAARQQGAAEAVRLVREAIALVPHPRHVDVGPDWMVRQNHRLDDWHRAAAALLASPPDAEQEDNK